MSMEMSEMFYKLNICAEIMEKIKSWDRCKISSTEAETGKGDIVKYKLRLEGSVPFIRSSL